MRLCAWEPRGMGKWVGMNWADDVFKRDHVQEYFEGIMSSIIWVNMGFLQKTLTTKTSFY